VDRVQLAEHELYTDCCENVFNVHSDVKRSALIPFVDLEGVSAAAIVIQPKSNFSIKDEEEKKRLTKEILTIAEGNWVTKKIKHVLIKESFPVDVRHNAKIKRDILTVWAAALPEGNLEAK
jgi:hypothetical protein